MGTDIHSRVEVRRDGRWEPVSAIFRYPYADTYYDEAGELKEEYKDREWIPSPMSPAPFGGRNYVVFSVLANVRNGYGFAGVYTHDPIDPIDEPRGLPDDLADHDPRISPFGFTASEYADVGQDGEELPITEQEALKKAKEWMFGDHSFTWVGLDELLAYDYDQPMQSGGVLYAHVYDEWAAAGKQGSPPNYAGGISGQKIENVAAADYDAMTEDEKASGRYTFEDGPGDGPFPESKATNGDELSRVWVVADRWDESLRDALGPEFFADLSRLEQYANEQEVDPEDVRVVMGFDS